MGEANEWDIYGKLTNKVNRDGSQLQDQHKHFLIKLFDKEPQATREDALAAAFEGFSSKESQKLSRNACQEEGVKEWVKKWSPTDMDHLSNCVFADKSAFDINMWPSTARSSKGTPLAIVTTPSTRAVSHTTILGAISAMGVVNIEIRLPNAKPKRIKVYGAR